MNNYANLQPADFEDVLARKLPPRGLAWLGPVFQAFWSAVGDALAAFHAREAILTEVEAFPPTSIELLPDWEEVLGLPDPCLPVPSVTSARQAAVAARLGASGGQSIPYFTQLAENLGGTIHATEYAPWRWGVDALWAPLNNPGWAYIWNVALTEFAIFDFEWGVSGCWEPFWQVANGPIQCEISRLNPAHTYVTFSGFLPDLDFAVPGNSQYIPIGVI